MDVRIHKKLIVLKSMLIQREPNKEAAAVELAVVLKCAIISQFGVSTKRVEPGSSTEVHKEPEDKHVVRQMICHLQNELPVMFSDEVDFKMKPNAAGLNGTLDLIVVKKSHYCYDTHAACIVHMLYDTDIDGFRIFVSCNITLCT